MTPRSPGKGSSVQYNSERFGKLDYDEAEVIRFPHGLIGFPDMTRYFVYNDTRVDPLAWLHSLDDPNLAFLICNPFSFFPDYEVRVKLPGELRRQIGDTGDLRVLAIVTIAADFARSTVNLLGPLVVNARTRNGWQIILDDADLSTRHLLLNPAIGELENAEAM
jgi:flagellar assembly factor FliW